MERANVVLLTTAATFLKIGLT